MRTEDQSLTQGNQTGSGVPGYDLDEIIAAARAELNLGPDRPWKIIAAKRKLGKLLFEVQEEGADGPIRMIGKVSREERTRVTHEALHKLWAAGFRPPAEFTVVKPILYLPSQSLIIQERAPGAEVMERIERQQPEALDLVDKSAVWLTKLHSAPIEFTVSESDTLRLAGWSADLQAAAPEHARRIEQIASATLAKRQARTPSGEPVPSHGDYHPMNIFFAETGRMTVIDIDKFGGRERSEEVAYFLAQTASICFHRLGGFESSVELRRRFRQAYEEASGVSLDSSDMGAFMAGTILKNLHFDLITYKTGRVEIIDEWMDAAESCLNGDIYFS